MKNAKSIENINTHLTLNNSVLVFRAQIINLGKVMRR